MNIGLYECSEWMNEQIDIERLDNNGRMEAHLKGFKTILYECIIYNGTFKPENILASHPYQTCAGTYCEFKLMVDSMFHTSHSYNPHNSHEHEIVQ